MKKILFTFLCLLYGHLWADSNMWGTIYATNYQQWIDKEQLINDLHTADIVLIGERHDVCSHHMIEQWLVKQTHATIALEMLDNGQQQQINEVQKWLHNGGKTSIRRLPEKISWKHSWDWDLYGALISQLLNSSNKILAANPSTKDIVNATHFEPTGINASNPKVKNALSQLMEKHHTSLKSRVNQQQFKDNNMADVLLNSSKPVWLIAGAIHVSKVLGVPLFIQDKGFSGKVFVLILTDTDSDIEYNHADYIWYLPKNLSEIACSKL